MLKHSAGILVYRLLSESVIEVLLVHPGGPFWAKKDIGSWSLPKGEYGPNEDPQQAARREFTEEIGHAAPEGEYVALGEVSYGNKVLIAWAVQGELDARHVVSNTFTIEWPPRSGKLQTFPEVDKAAWFGAAAACQKLVPGQVEFVTRLEKMVLKPSSVPGISR